MKMLFRTDVSRRRGFSLIEVVLAIGIFLVTVLALVGLLGPTLQSVNEVEKTDEVSSVVYTLNAFLQSSTDIATGDATRLEAIYDAVAGGGEATVFIYRWYHDDPDGEGNPIVLLEVGFADAEASFVGADSIVNVGEADFSNAAGTIYRAVLTPSSVLEEDVYREDDRSRSTGVFSPKGSYETFYEGSYAMEVRIFAEDAPGPDVAFEDETDLAELVTVDPIFSYNTAILR